MKRFKAVINDSGISPYWETVRPEWRDSGYFEVIVATFLGNHCRQYARDHAKRLNALPEKEKP